MIKTIRLQNFMAHQDTGIDLSPGVTVITGPNNIGKSAVVEAIRYLVYNPSPKNIIRHGAKKALVHLELDSGETITWQRQDKNASYTLEQPGQEPQEYHKFGRDVPQDVRNLLRLELVKTDTDDIDIHLGNQRQPIFLLDRPGSHAAGFFAASTEADYLLKMQQLLKGKIEQAKRDRKRLDTELLSLTQQLHHYEPLSDLAVHIARAEANYAAILETNRQLPLLEGHLGQLSQNQAKLHFLEQAAAILAALSGPPGLHDITGLALLVSELADRTRQRHLEAARKRLFTDLTPPPALDPTGPLESWLLQTQAAQLQYATAQTRSRVLDGLAPPPEIMEVEKLNHLVQTYEHNLGHRASLHRRQSLLAPLAEPPQLEATAPLEDLIIQMRRDLARSDILRIRHRHLADLSLPPETTPPGDLEKTLTALDQAAAQISRLQSSLAGVTVRLEAKKAEIQTYLQDTGLCPLCGSPLDLDHFLENRHV